MTIFSRGQKGKLADLGCTGTFRIVVNLAGQGLDLDVTCFGLDEHGQLSDDRYMVFFNQKACPGEAVILEMGNGSSTFTTNVDLLPTSIHKLVFAASIGSDGTMRKLGPSSMLLGNVEFGFSGSDFQDEKAVIIGEVYRRDGLWRFGAVGQGFNGGLSALLKHFGGTEAESSAVRPPAPPPATEPKKVSLSKVTLEKRGEKVSLEKSSSGGFGRIRVNLNWNQAPVPTAEPKPGFFGKLMGSGQARSSSAIDLDLGCYFELMDGTAGGVQALGNSWGSFNSPPYIHLDGDDRSGANTEGENLFINGDQFNQIKRVLVFAYIYNGVPNWAHTDGVVTIEVPGRAPVEVRLDNGSDAGMCAIAMIDNLKGNLQVTKVVEYFAQRGDVSFHEAVSDRFGFGLRFRAGSKD